MEGIIPYNKKEKRVERDNDTNVYFFGKRRRKGIHTHKLIQTVEIGRKERKKGPNGKNDDDDGVESSVFGSF